MLAGGVALGGAHPGGAGRYFPQFRAVQLASDAPVMGVLGHAAGLSPSMRICDRRSLALLWQSTSRALSVIDVEQPDRG